MRQLLWIGCLESEIEFKNKAKKGYDLASAQVSQKNLISGLEEVTGLLFDSINGSVLPPYPIYEDREILPVEWEHQCGCRDISVGYRNDKYVNRLYCKNAMLREARKWVESRYKHGELIILVYSMRSASMATACWIKRKIKDAKIYLIVTDLPQFMDLGESKLKAALKRIDWISIKKMQEQFDGFILYAKKMAEFLKIPDGKWMLMEGSYDVSENIRECTDTIPKTKAIMYSGKLEKGYGIPMLIDAFMQIKDKDLELWFTGGGNAEEYIRDCAIKDSRIKFWGFLPTREDVLNKQLQAALLVNMRLPSETVSTYSFPSKLFEYMATGVPVLSFKSEGIPEEYYKYIITVEAETTQALMNTIKYAMDMSLEKRTLLGRQARSFICNKKNHIIQSTNICKFIGFI